MRPYVIASPGYTEKSWGVRTLHQLCHRLNLLGVPATARASFACYSTLEEVAQLEHAVRKAREVFA